MKNYLELMDKIIREGIVHDNRTGTDSLCLFGEQLKFDLQDGFPLVTTKRVWFKGIVTELLWMLRGQTNVRALNEEGNHIWDSWADEDGNLGPIYGHQWRFAGGDQLVDLWDRMQGDPESRRHVCSAWRHEDVDHMALAPCHVLFQFRVMGGRLHCHMYQRSCDFFLGGPFNIAQYALLTHLFAKTLDLGVGVLTVSYGDVHLYVNHLDQCRRQLQETPRPLPRITIQGKRRPWLYTTGDIKLSGYTHGPHLGGQVAV